MNTDPVSQIDLLSAGTQYVLALVLHIRIRCIHEKAKMTVHKQSSGRKTSAIIILSNNDAVFVVVTHSSRKNVDERLIAQHVCEHVWLRLAVSQ